MNMEEKVNVILTSEDFDTIVFAERQLILAMENCDDDTAHDISIHTERLRQIQAKYLAVLNLQYRRKGLYRMATAKYPNMSRFNINKIIDRLMAKERDSDK